MVHTDMMVSHRFVTHIHDENLPFTHIPKVCSKVAFVYSELIFMFKKSEDTEKDECFHVAYTNF